jgi:DNA-binding LacI/PurR family transcriptional regulator
MVVRLADVAKAAGVSPSTVSRALSGAAKVNAGTRERIARTAQEMGYEPNQVARSLTSGRTDLIGLIVPDIANPFFPPIIKAVQARARQRGRTVLIADLDEHMTDEVQRARLMRKQVDGLIVGHDVSVIGIDDSPMAEMSFPPLTSIHVPGAGAGVAAVDLLLDLVDRGQEAEARTIQLETRLTIRSSTGAVPS